MLLNVKLIIIIQLFNTACVIINKTNYTKEYYTRRYYKDVNSKHLKQCI